MNDVWQYLMLVLAVSGCICLPQVTTLNDNNAPGGVAGTTIPPLVCNTPYLQAGDYCCLDRDGSGVCDVEELLATETTLGILLPTTTVVVTTTQQTVVSTTSSTSTQTTVIKCYGPEDCGVNKSYVKCLKGDPYFFEEKPYCRYPGSSESVCMVKVAREILDDCVGVEVCLNGRCMDIYSGTCRQACRNEGFDYYYCYKNIDCEPGHYHTPYGDDNCTATGNPYCCCHN